MWPKSSCGYPMLHQETISISEKKKSRCPSSTTNLNQRESKNVLIVDRVFIFGFENVLIVDEVFIFAFETSIACNEARQPRHGATPELTETKISYILHSLRMSRYSRPSNQAYQ